MSVADVGSSAAAGGEAWGSWTDDFFNQAASGTLEAASLLTDPVCNAHESYRQIQVVDALNPQASVVANLARKFFFFVKLVAWACLALFTTLPGIGLRFFGSHIQREPFTYSVEKTSGKTLPQDRTFSVLLWNVCGTKAGYVISDGGVVPLVPSRIDDVLRKIVEADADVNCLCEVFDIQDAKYICEQLKQSGYGHFYFNMGARAVGVTSGILVASKYAIKNPEFTPFPVETLVGRTKKASKGMFTGDLVSDDAPFATVFVTHAQHDEEPEFPTPEAVEARRQQMQIIVDKVNRIRDRCVVVTGDLNMDDVEFNASAWRSRFQKGDHYEPHQKTWGGDAFCAQLCDKRISGPLNLDHTMVLNGSARAIHTTLIETGFDAAVFRREALSDHAGLYSRITV